jgi:hypothetical protein
MTLTHYIDPDAYHPDAVARAVAGDLAELDPNLLIIRLGVALRDQDRMSAKAVLDRLEQEQMGGYMLYQVTTGRMIFAHLCNEKSAFDHALAAWLTGRQLYPGNWTTKILDEPELASWLADKDLAALVTPIVWPKPEPLTAEDRAYVKNFDLVRLAAINENLQWLREMGLTDTVEDLAQSYTLASINRHLREANLSRHDDYPDIILAFDEDGRFVGSFLAH